METPATPQNPSVSSKRRVMWALLVGGLIIAASSRSVVASPHVTQVDDKIAHFSVYGLLGTLACRAFGGGWRGAIGGLLAASAFGVSDEWHQSFVPGRSCDVMDWVADTSGAALAVLMYTGWGWYRRCLEFPILKLWPRPEKTSLPPA